MLNKKNETELEEYMENWFITLRHRFLFLWAENLITVEMWMTFMIYVLIYLTSKICGSMWNVIVVLICSKKKVGLN